MEVQRILTFLQALRQNNSLSSIDKKLLEKLTLRFSSRAEKTSLGREDVDFLLECFKERWLQVFDEELDYTLDPSGVNQLWIALAKDLVPLTTKNFQQILIPTFTNEYDFNNITLLTETERLDNLYLGPTGTVLHRKRGLCEHLLKHDLQLSTYRAVQTRRLYPLTIIELARLQRQPKVKFSINGTEFASFWDFLQQNIFCKLQEKGNMPHLVLVQLIDLLENYFANKHGQKEFSLFKTRLDHFFSFLNQFDLDTVNFFYGIKATFAGQPCYLLELLIKLQLAKDFTLDDVMIALSEMLYKINPFLRVKSSVIASIYAKLPSDDVQKITNHLDSLKTLRLIVSLLATRFELSSFSSRKTISFWDRSNQVSGVCEDVFKRVMPLIENNQREELVRLYPKLLENHIKPDHQDPGFFAHTLRYPSTDNWLTVIEKANFQEIDIYWFPAEVMFCGLREIAQFMPQMRDKINPLLDDIVKTFGQSDSINCLKKAIRVNILFSDFIKQFDAVHKRLILLALNLYDAQLSKDRFMAECKRYIANRLTEMTGDPSRFNFIHGLSDQSKVAFLLNAFKTKIRHPDLKVDRTMVDKLSDYLFDLGRPILSVEEKELANKEASQAEPPYLTQS
jgi:hypothetical protein